VGHTLLRTHLPPQHIGEDEDTTRKHVFSCWGGRLDGSRCGPACGGGHTFVGPTIDGVGRSGNRQCLGGEWGLRRSRDMLAPAGSMPTPLLAARLSLSRWRSSTLAFASPAAPSIPSMVAGSVARLLSTLALSTSSPPSGPATATGSTTLVQTPTMSPLLPCPLLFRLSSPFPHLLPDASSQAAEKLSPLISVAEQAIQEEASKSSQKLIYASPPCKAIWRQPLSWRSKWVCCC
jgi:hypothetical protein